ncbi:MAG: M48 family metalloprotease [Planctomycetota bacterium]|nr:M48 family metalloprotease [Planctomycetota bacterium]
MIIALLLWLAAEVFTPAPPDWAADWFPPGHLLIPLLILILAPVLVLLAYLLLVKLVQSVRGQQDFTGSHYRYFLHIQSPVLLLTWTTMLWLAHWYDRAELLLPVSGIAVAAASTILPLLVACGLCAALRFWFFVGSRPRMLLAAFLGEIRSHLIVVIPLVFVHGIGDWMRVNPDHRLWLEQQIPVSIEVLLVIIFLLLAPALVTWTLNAHPMPEGAMRDRWKNLAKKAGVVLRQPYIWRTGWQPVATAMVAGLFSFHRRFFITDYFLERLGDDEADSAFAHELAHARLHHVMYLLGVTCSFYYMLVSSLDTSNILAPAAFFILITMTFWIFFGRISRHLEHQADIFSDQLTENPGGIGQTLTRLIEIHSMNPKRRGWRHPAPHHRIEVVKQYQQDPQFKKAFDRHHTRLMLLIGLLCVLMTGVFLSQQFSSRPGEEWETHLARGHSHLAAAQLRLQQTPSSNLRRHDELSNGAERWLQQGIQLLRVEDPDHPSLSHAYHALASICQQQGRVEEANRYSALAEAHSAW